MIIKSDILATELLNAKDENAEDPFVVTPEPCIDELQKSGAASIDLRLGSWFLLLHRARVDALDVYIDKIDTPKEVKLTRTQYIPFHDSYILHPKTFVLGTTLEWIRMPKKYAGYVVGKSSWGRHGLIIATATGVHPGFSGCLTLEITNIGEVPIKIKPGTKICQLFVHSVKSEDYDNVDKSNFNGRRKPILGAITIDNVAKKLSEPVF